MKLDSSHGFFRKDDIHQAKKTPAI